MEEIRFNKLYNLDKERLYANFERIQNLHNNLDSTEIITNFLLNQSIGISTSEISDILNYYQKKLSKNKTLLDFAFEWIRAYKIRLEYKKYFNLNSYGAFTVALDDTIFLFFLKYDKYLRPLFEEDMEEYEFATLYQIFFNSKQSNPINLIPLLKKNKDSVPTIIINGERINTKIHTIREGLSGMIKDDFNEGLPTDVKIISYEQEEENDTISEIEFNGTMIERLIKFYCFQKRNIDEKELTLAITQFLSSYFQFGAFYNFNEFKNKLILSFADYIFSGLTDDYKNYSVISLQNELTYVIEEFEKRLKHERLKGKAWIEDLKPILRKFIDKFIDRL
ncbi:MAG: hypothetical protein EAX89_17405 [Candidatus Lokiarchaeota archaeon]|nr:hypothetical protein [Candidatus Lokiarchaeota archaeon]